jgi:hypothetical protein
MQWVRHIRRPNAKLLIGFILLLVGWQEHHSTGNMTGLQKAQGLLLRREGLDMISKLAQYLSYFVGSLTSTRPRICFCLTTRYCGGLLANALRSELQRVTGLRIVLLHYRVVFHPAARGCDSAERFQRFNLWWRS